jgi:DnaJ-class molecular chaperone
MSKGAWLKWAGKNEVPTHKTSCPDCHGRGRWEVGSIDDVPLYERCLRCNGTGEVGAVVVKGARMDDQGELIRWNPDEPIELERYMRLSRIEEEDDVSRQTIKASVVAAVKEQLAVTDEELAIAAQVGVTEAELIQQKALDQLSDREIQMMRSGLTPVEILASRIVR